MKFIKALILGAIPWYPIGWAIYKVTGEDGLALVVTSIISIVIFFIAINKLGSDESGSTMVSNVFGAMRDMKDGVEFNLEQKSADLYAQAEEEYDNGKIDKGLWSQALIKAKGEESLRKVEYMKLRAKQLKKNA
ncbi:MAG: hypothetical protein CL539_12440 [Alcanivorax sp.]|jgi:hypothetical protein|uniref:hypothetical protein n=1 Tax=unclassified Alcanivorax TaxID=2638842 RepID=UPI000C935A1A|nr:MULTISPECIES: hypothetical protein [unclassified Alcanivorax]MAC15454.1 hypothetical protein [Alcanivorax sp.]|tara:strand:- start:181 stop:582 length:402 start_codon:yes stop_codon:yes gene_type:complete